MATLEQKAKEARLKVLEMVHKAKSSHIGSNFSVIDILTVLFDKVDTEKDKVILSAGWKAASFYYFLSKAGYFPEEWLDTYNQEGSKLIGLTEPGVPGVLFAGGSMQMGLPAAVGFALSKKMKGEEGIVYCIMSDGEMAGGMVWESIWIANHHKLNNLVIIVDNNGLQAMGSTRDILNVPFVKTSIDGHNYKAIRNALNRAIETKEAFILVANTTKGKGVSFMENNNLYHYKDLSNEEYQKAKDELQNG